MLHLDSPAKSLQQRDCLVSDNNMNYFFRNYLGVDWKSLTIPACLPITTDYFPDKRSLHNDYVVSDYTLLPEGVNAEYAQRRAIYRKPLSTEEVFKETISQRLAQVSERLWLSRWEWGSITNITMIFRRVSN